MKNRGKTLIHFLRRITINFAYLFCIFEMRYVLATSYKQYLVSFTLNLWKCKCNDLKNIYLLWFQWFLTFGRSKLKLWRTPEVWFTLRVRVFTCTNFHKFLWRIFSKIAKLVIFRELKFLSTQKFCSSYVT